MYCGIDVSKNKSYICIMDKEKKVLKEFSIEHSIEGFQKLEKELTPNTMIGMEVTGNYSKTLFDYLRQRKYRVTYVDNFKMNTFAQLHSPQVKNDKTDARLITMYVASPDELTRVEVPEMNELKDLANLYDKTSRQLSRHKCMVKNQINIIFPELESIMSNNSNMGIGYMLLKFPTPKEIAEATDEEIRDALRENLKRAGKFDLEYAKKIKALASQSIGVKDYPVLCFKQTVKTMLFYTIQAKAIKESIEEALKKTTYARLMEDFGYNVVSLATIIGIVGDIRRFSNHKKFASYCGFGIREKRSGSSINKSTHITKKGNSRLRQTFHMMALIHIAYKTEFSKYYSKLKERGKHPKKCLVAVARKLAVKAYYDLLKCHDRKI